ncbi:MAG: DNA primase small subunit domain-containing protein, partial [Promethearchaeota archaeon]
MSDFQYLNRLFKEYYKKWNKNIPLVTSFEEREFGFIPWDKQTRMIRHLGFRNKENFIKYILNSGPRHIYSSGARYVKPESQTMESKDYQGCDLIIDIDVDHFYTPCKDDHDFWYCKECGKNGIGMVEKCPHCKKSKIKTLAWICEDCLKIAKNEIIKLIYDFLVPDFGIQTDQISVAFSGHRGYHLKVSNDAIRTLTSDERREIADYVSGENISFEIWGLKERGGIIFGFTNDNIGWAQKIITKLEEILSKSDSEIEDLLTDNR